MTKAIARLVVVSCIFFSTSSLGTVVAFGENVKTTVGKVDE